MDFYGWTVDKLAELSTKFLQPEELRLIFDMPAYCQRKELVAALNATICVGAELCVFEYSRHSDSWQWRDCSVVETRKPDKVEVLYHDDSQLATHRLSKTKMMINDEQGEEWETESEGEDEETDLPASWGLEPGCRIEVLREVTCDDGSIADLWWGATLLKRMEGNSDAAGRQLYKIKLDASYDCRSQKEYFSFASSTVVVDSMGDMFNWRLEGAGDEEEEEEQLQEVMQSISDWTKKELKAYCHEHGVPVSGNKAELLQLVAQHMLQIAAADEETPSEDSEVDGITAGMHNLSTGGEPQYAYGMPPAGGPKKRALLVGCSYEGTAGYLAGTLPDVVNMYALLVEHFRFPADSIMLLTDGQKDRFRLPTRHNILKGFEWLMHDLQPGDSRFFYFSGHGGKEVDSTGEEPSGFNQTICPLDYEKSGCIKDTVIHKMLVHPLPIGVTLHALIDSCHSGTVMNLPYNALLQEGQLNGWEEEYAGRAWKKTTAGGLVVQFSAARHDQLAREKSRRSKNGTTTNVGAATYAFIQAIKRHKGVWGFEIPYGDLLQAMYDELRGSRFDSQEPTLSSSAAFDCESCRIKLKL